ncbi:tetratricopeptide repeat-containing sensor histidine kinase [Algibacter lectus]|uniref:tetratricopeptide repeat-containing sensor histidine kinase n=1 Tax=Algibacter lectus TaxID=221126 RepID=UPI0026F2BF13|nr:ATP-binding protein [Algibacter lectus]MDO7136281.1 ATP-binding protein [Algibacter lectus]
MPNVLHIKKLNLPHIFIFIAVFTLFNAFSAYSKERLKKEIQRDIKKIQETPHFEKDTTYINLLHELIREYNQYNLDSLLIISNQTIKLSKAIKYDKGETEGYIIKGGYYSDIGEQDDAIFYFIKANLKARAINDTALTLYSYSELAKEYMYKDEYAKSLKTFLTGIEIAKDSQNDKWLPILYINISVLYSLQKEYEQAVSFLKKALDVNERNDDQRLTGIILSNLAFSYIEIGNIENAKEPVNKAITIFEDLEQNSWLTYVYEIKGTIFLKKNEYDHALFWLNKSEVLHKNIDQTRYKIPLYLLLSKAYYGLRSNEIAASYAVKALEISKDLNNLENRDEILKILYEVKKADEDFGQALTYLEEFKAISDTINKKNNIKELSILKSNLEFEQEKEKYISDNEQKNLLQRSYIYFSILIILAFTIIIVILKRNNKIQNSLNQKLIENTHALKKNEIHLNGANNTKIRLFSIIAHDLKGPINSFKSLLDLFNKSELSQTEFMHFMPQIGENIESIAFTLNNLLTWGQSQMNGLSTKPDLINVNTLVEDSLRLLSKQADVKSISTINKVEDHVITWSDRDQIDIVIRNLISNAVKFTRAHGTITVAAIEQNEFWQIQIKDNGVGMSEDVLTNIFSEKETSTTYGTQNEKGTGLGLRVCKEMVENNGGTIWVESEIEKGSTFYFTLPKGEKL